MSTLWIGPLSWGYDPQDDHGYERDDGDDHYPDDDDREQVAPLSDPEPLDPELAEWLAGARVFSDHEQMRQEIDPLG